jgi:hypothetical protein
MASLSGTLNVSLIHAFVPTLGSTFKIMNFSSETGQFSICQCGINSTEHFVVSYQSTDVLLTVASGMAPSLRQFNRANSLSGSMVGRTYGGLRSGDRRFQMVAGGSMIDSRELSSTRPTMAKLAAPEVSHSLVGSPARFSYPIGFTKFQSHTVRVHNVGTFALSNQLYSSSKLPTSARSYLGLQGASPVKQASFDSLGRQNAMRLREAAAFNFVRGNVPTVSRNFMKIDASRGIPNRINLAVATFPHTPGLAKRGSLNSGINVLPFLRMSPRHFSDAWRQSGSSNLGFVTFQSN